MDFDNWPTLYWPDELALIREFLRDEEFAELLHRLMLVLPDGPLVDRLEVFERPSENRRGELRDEESVLCGIVSEALMFADGVFSGESLIRIS
jgi:hypothetical protein